MKDLSSRRGDHLRELGLHKDQLGRKGDGEPFKKKREDKEKQEARAE